MELKEHIDDIRTRLENREFRNETAVSLGVVYRLLAALRWPTYNPQIVSPEHPIDTGKVDYALCHPAGEPLVLIEVKRGGNIEGAERQLFEYAFHHPTPILILTNGRLWRFFHSSGSMNYTEQFVCEFDIIEDDSEEIATRLNRYLNYISIQTGKAMAAIEEDYHNVFRNREILRLLPEAWNNLVSGESEDSGQLLTAVKSEIQRLCGNSPTNEQVFSFLKSLKTETDDIRTYFQVLIDELGEEHNFTADVRRLREDKYCHFQSDFPDIMYYAQFGGKRRVYTGLFIESGNYEKDVIFFHLLKERESEINAKFGAPLCWVLFEKRSRCVIRIEGKGSVKSDARVLETIRTWHIENLLRFKEVFTPEIQRALDRLKSSETDNSSG